MEDTPRASNIQLIQNQITGDTAVYFHVSYKLRSVSTIVSTCVQ